MVRAVGPEPFIDEVTIGVRAGHGGAGCVHFRREPFVPRGGPDGGDGGRGGDVVLRATTHINTLNRLRRKRFVRAEDGKPGAKQRMTGAAGADAVIDVPVGTLVFAAESNELLADLDHDGVTFVVARGGKGGLGNWHFRSPTNRAPEYAQPGLAGEVLHLRLELRLLADVGLVGFPNAGKSSTIRVLTRARPKVADYPFTTLVPNLGVVEDVDGDGYVIADVPGLIEGAAQGAGLGHAFLRHIARTRLLVHVLELGPGVTVDDLLARQRTIEDELAHSPVRITAPIALLLLNKVDLVPDLNRAAVADALRAETGIEVLFASTATGEGIEVFKRRLSEEVAKRLRADAVDAASPNAVSASDAAAPDPEAAAARILGAI